MKKITRWLLAVSLVWGTAVFTSCSNVDGSSAESFDAAEELSGEKFLHDEWMDRSVKPGDSFWKYALGRWLKKHSQSDDGLMDYVQMSIKEDLYDGMSSAKSSGTGHILKLIAGPTPSPDDETAAVNDVLSLLNDDPDITMEDVIYDAGKLADLKFNSIFGHEIANINGTLKYALIPGVSAVSSDAFEIMTIEGIKMEVMETFLQWGYDVSSSEMKSSIKAIANIETELHELQKDWSDPVPSFKGKSRIVKNSSLLLASNLTIRSGLTAGGKNLETAFKKAFHVDNQTYYLPEVEKVFDMLGKYDAMTWHNYMVFYTLYRLGQVVFKTEKIAEEIYENMNELLPSTFLDYQASALCKDADIDGAYQMLELLREKMTDRINNLDWLGTATKQKAIEKLQAMKFNVCAPEKMFNANFKLTGKTPVEDFVQYSRQVDEYVRTVLAGKKTKDYGWESVMNSFAGIGIDNVNAMYLAELNQIFIFPAFIRSELFPKDNDDVMRYVTLCVFGHEMTHGFDGEGATYDKTGTKSNWWTAEDEKKFEERKKQMVDLYSDLEVLPGVKTDGEKTLDENIADLGGFNLAWQVWNDKLEADGLTDEELRHRQREFFLGLANLWQSDADEETLLECHKIDEHAADHVRVNGISRLIDDWYTLFGVEPGDELYVKPEDRVKIW